MDSSVSTECTLHDDPVSQKTRMMTASRARVEMTTESFYGMVKASSKVICMIGCCLHLIAMGAEYLKYRTVAMYGPYVPLEQSLPSQTICFVPSSYSLTNVTFLEQEPIQDTTRDKSVDPFIDVSSVLSDCRLKNFSKNRVDEFANCSTVFLGTRFTSINHYDCYTFRFRHQVTFSTLETAASMLEKDLLFSFFLTDYYSNFSRLTLLLHSQQFAGDEVFYAMDLEVLQDRKTYTFTESYEFYEFERLESPYETHCTKQQPPNCVDVDETRVNTCENNLCHQIVTVTQVTIDSKALAGVFVKVKPMATPIIRVEYSVSWRFDSFFIDVSGVLSLWCSLSIHLVSQRFLSFLRSKNDRRPVSAETLIRWQTKLVQVCKSVNIDYSELKASIERQLTMSKDTGWKRRMFQTLVKFATLYLFARELTLISLDYFQYQTKVNIDIQLNSRIKLPDVSFCIDMHQAIGVPQGGYEMWNIDSQMTRVARDMRKYNLRAILDALPKKALKKCRVRPHLHSTLITYHNCSQHFNISKFTHDMFVCYFIHPLFNYTTDGRTVRKGDSNAQIVYSLVPDKWTGWQERTQPMVSFGLPVKSRFLSHRLFRVKGSYELIILTYLIYRSIKLPPPYDTNCSPKNEFNECQIKCLNYSRFDRVPYSEVHARPQKVTLLDFIDLKNHTLAALVRQSEERCNGMCREHCEDSITKTITQKGHSGREWTEIALASPKYPLYHLTAVPVYTQFNYIYQLGCCASFWIGFSLIILADEWWRLGGRSQAPSRMEQLSALTRHLEKEVSSRLHSMTDSKLTNGCVAMSHLRRRIKGLLYLSLLMIGFYWHASYTVKYYFEYPTRMDTTLELESEYSDLRATICFTIDQLNLTGDYSTRNIWEQSPRVDQIILGCGHRAFNLSKLAHLPTELKERIMAYIVESVDICNALFTVRKMITLGMVCYETRPNMVTRNSQFNSKYHLLGAKNYMYLTLRRSIAQYNMSIAVSQGPARVSLLFSCLVPSPSASDNTWSWVSYSKYVITSLPFPYQMGVFHGVRQLWCTRECVHRQTVDHLKRVPTFGEINYPSEMAHETDDETSSPESAAIRKRCEQWCDHQMSLESAEKSYYQTYFSSFSREGPKSELGTFAPWFRNSDYFVPHTTFYPALRTIDLVLYIGSIYSVWFGLSALQTIDIFFTKPRPTHLTIRDREDLLVKYEKLKKCWKKDQF